MATFFDFEITILIHRQIYETLRDSIRRRERKPGERLPSTRALAEELGVSRTPVLLAFENLLSEGYITGRTGSGTYVAATLPEDMLSAAGASSGQTKPDRFRPRWTPYGSGLARRPAFEIHTRLPAKPRTIDFRYGSGALHEFPIAAWRRLLAHHAERLTQRKREYGHAQGAERLRELIAAHARRSRAVECDAERVVVVNGSQQGLDLIARLLIHSGDRVVMENPHYQGARHIFGAMGARLVPVAVDAQGLRTDKLPRAAHAVYVTPSHQFPTGATMPVSRRLELLQWARRTDALVIEDDYDGDFRYEGRPLESLQGLDTDGRVLYAGTFSRSLFASLRLGYVILPRAMVETFVRAKWLADRHASSLEQLVLADLMASGEFDQYLRRVRRRHAARREALLEACADELGDRVVVGGAAAGVHIVLWIAGRHPSEAAALVARAAEAGVGVYEINGYYSGTPYGDLGILLGYGTLQEPEIREGIRRLATVI